MPRHSESRTIAQPAERLFDIVADVERYPDFLPLMREAKIVHRGDDVYETEQALALGLLVHRFRTRTLLDRPRGITVVSSDPLFRRFDLRWVFSPLADDRCQVDFAIDCEASSFFLLPFVQMVVLPMAGQMVAAFEARALATERAGR
ncbi:MAG TPA: type II toxin-antitoxin system RatA family toxin [Accumulibacter sp.]|jgi:coenzyme Q-binding protein COQ10|nr:type II toxin-antitoxin system RatA family toxin [Accumulibacter sp.]